jgi:hypothetical protein
VEALTTLGGSTRRGTDAIGRFGIGFASVFDPSLGVKKVEFTAAHATQDGVKIWFLPDAGGGVSIRVEPAPRPKNGGSRVEVSFDPGRAPTDRVTRAVDIFETHAAYSGVETDLNGRTLGRELADYIRAELRAGTWSGGRNLIARRPSRVGRGRGHRPTAPSRSFGLSARSRLDLPLVRILGVLAARSSGARRGLGWWPA